MPKYITKHMPVDDARFIVYASTDANVPDIANSISIESTKSVAQGGNFIDVDTESCHVFLGLNCHKISEIYRNILILEVNLNHRNENSLFHSE